MVAVARVSRVQVLCLPCPAIRGSSAPGRVCFSCPLHHLVALGQRCCRHLGNKDVALLRWAEGIRCAQGWLGAEGCSSVLPKLKTQNPQLVLGPKERCILFPAVTSRSFSSSANGRRLLQGLTLRLEGVVPATHFIFSSDCWIKFILNFEALEPSPSPWKKSNPPGKFSFCQKYSFSF